MLGLTARREGSQTRFSMIARLPMSPRERILHPYVRRVDDLRHRIGKLGVVSLFLLVAAIMGFLFAILPLELYIIPFMPVILLLGAVLWLAPDIDPELDRPIRFLFLFTLGANMFWPHYMAFVLPGVGYITPYRLSLLVLTGFFLFSLATSKRMRTTIKEALDAAPVTKWSFFIFMGIFTVLTLVWTAFTSTVLIQIFYWYLLFIVALFCFSFRGVPLTFGVLFLILIPWVAGLSFFEFSMRYKPWVEYVPTYLRGDPETWAKVAYTTAQRYTGEYRASGLFNTSLTMGEYCGLAFPFALWATFHYFQGWKKVFGVALVVLIVLGVVSTGSRTGWGGLLVGSATFLFLWGYRRWKQQAERRDLVGPAMMAAYPAAFLAATLAVLFVGRVRVRILGGGQHTYSDGAREEQWARTIAALKRNPFGHGPNRAWEQIQYYNLGGQPTIDGYYMNLLLDFGVIGAALWVTFFVSAIYLASRTYVLSANRDEEVGVAVACGLVAYLVAKYGLSQVELQHYEFALAGLAVGIAWRQKVRIEAMGDKIDILPPGRTPPPRPRLRLALTRSPA